jgi:hypothetical protein
VVSRGAAWQGMARRGGARQGRAERLTLDWVWAFRFGAPVSSGLQRTRPESFAGWLGEGCADRVSSVADWGMLSMGMFLA